MSKDKTVLLQLTALELEQILAKADFTDDLFFKLRGALAYLKQDCWGDHDR